MAGPFWELVQTYYTAPEGIEPHGVLLPEAWDFYMTYLLVGEGEQKALASPVDLSAILTDEIVEAAWDGLDMDAAVAK